MTVQQQVEKSPNASYKFSNK